MITREQFMALKLGDHVTVAWQPTRTMVRAVVGDLIYGNRREVLGGNADGRYYGFLGIWSADEARESLSLGWPGDRERELQIRAALERLESAEYPEPGCTCTRTDVDVFDARTCEFCHSNSEWNRERRSAEKAIQDNAYQWLKMLVEREVTQP